MGDAKVWLAGIVLVGASVLHAQKTQSQPVNDSAAQASPTGSASKAPATDSSQQASPVSEPHGGAQRLPARTTVHITLNEGIDSSTLKNGQSIRGKVQSAGPDSHAPGTMSGRGQTSKTGTPVLISVIATVPAGKLNAVGEMSLELVQIGGQAVSTDIQTFRGEPGKRDVADSAPTVGTNAGLPAGAELAFTVRPEPSFTQPEPGKGGPQTQGGVTRRASGSKPANYGQPTVTAAPGSNQGFQDSLPGSSSTATTPNKQ